jgi:hypothetical protein
LKRSNDGQTKAALFGEEGADAWERTSVPADDVDTADTRGGG